ncbi:MAG: hypothetical protein ICV73_20560 [Acetobacteraceae bacterium]|nr:hypothetical protein [Acetobacteraceae bacterium]
MEDGRERRAVLAAEVEGLRALAERLHAEADGKMPPGARPVSPFALRAMLRGIRKAAELAAADTRRHGVCRDRGGQGMTEVLAAVAAATGLAGAPAPLPSDGEA